MYVHTAIVQATLAVLNVQVEICLLMSFYRRLQIGEFFLS